MPLKFFPHKYLGIQDRFHETSCISSFFNIFLFLLSDVWDDNERLRKRRRNREVSARRAPQKDFVYLRVPYINV